MFPPGKLNSEILSYNSGDDVGQDAFFFALNRALMTGDDRFHNYLTNLPNLGIR